jgi:Fe-S-cluster-containing hydrogenase component 2
MVVINDPKKCLSCAGCVGVCPVDAISLEDMRIKVSEARCTNCGICVRFCPAGAMKL